MIELKNASKVYGKKSGVFTALDNVSVSIKTGASVAVIGKSGSGKSTLMHVMSGLDPATSGTVKIGGQDIGKMSEKAVDVFRNKQMGFIFQSFFIEANQSCIDNVSLPLEIAKISIKKRRALAADALNEVELSDKANSKARNLSGGQKQRLAIARAIVNKPKLIFADEPTGNLDSATGEKIIQLLFGLNKKMGSTLVMVTHDHELAARCDVQIHIKDGKIEKITGDKSAASMPAPSEGIIKTVTKKVASKFVRIVKKLVYKPYKFILAVIRIDLWPRKFVRIIKSIPDGTRVLSTLMLRSGRTLKSAKVRTFLTAMAIGVGGFTLTLTLAAGNGVRDYTTKLISSNFDPAELIVGRDKEISNNGSPGSTPQEFDETVGTLEGGGGQNSFQVKRVTREDINELKTISGVEKVRENYQINVRYITRDGQKRYTGGAQVYNSAQKPEIKTGVLPTSEDNNKGNIILPDVYLDLLGFKDAQDAIGKSVSIAVQQPFSIESLQTLLISNNPSTIAEAGVEALKPKELTADYKISAVTKKSATSLSFGVPPLLLSRDDARELYEFTEKGTSDYEKFLFIFARVTDGQDDNKLQAVRTDLESKGYFVQSSKDIQKTITQFVNILQIMVGVLGLITLIASVFGVVNTQYISVLERTREIGLMKALGMSRKNISNLFILEAMWIGFIGGMLGIIGGFVLGIAVNPWITKKLDLGAGNALLQFSVLQMVILLLALMLVAAVAGLLPARKASKLDPVEALRTE